jgi:hypothetical protein
VLDDAERLRNEVVLAWRATAIRSSIIECMPGVWVVRANEHGRLR